MTDDTTPLTATNEGDWIPEVDESGETPAPTGRLLNRYTGETREAPAPVSDEDNRNVNAETGEIRDAAGRHVGFEEGSAGDDSRGTAPDASAAG